MVSGSSDNTIRIWDIECGACLRMLEGHDDLVRYDKREGRRERGRGGGRGSEVMGGVGVKYDYVFYLSLCRCIRFDDKRIVSGAYDG